MAAYFTAMGDLAASHRQAARTEMTTGPRWTPSVSHAGCFAVVYLLSYMHKQSSTSGLGARHVSRAQ